MAHGDNLLHKQRGYFSINCATKRTEFPAGPEYQSGWLDGGEYKLGKNTSPHFQNQIRISFHSGYQHAIPLKSRMLAQLIAGGMAMPEPSDPLVNAAFADDLQELESLLVRSNVNLRDKRTGTTALEYAVRNGNREMVQALLRAGAEVNSRDEAKQTVLMMLGEESTGDIVWDLIHAGAKVDLKDEEGDTALIEAAMINNAGVVSTLLQAGAKVDDRNNQGQTAFMFAATYGLMKNVRALITAGADMNARDRVGKTPLTYAKENDHGRLVKLLQSYGAIEGDVAKDK